MAGLALTVVASPRVSLRRRFELAAAGEPLCALSEQARAELEHALAGASGAEDLPGKWQAALARAEADVRGTPAAAPGTCCGGATVV